jgi:predicted nucleotidyltransferase component of viral defense system
LSHPGDERNGDLSPSIVAHCLYVLESSSLFHDSLTLKLSWGVNPTYTHDWNAGGSEIRLQISRRETPTLPTERRGQIGQSYFRFLPFVPADIVCLALAEIIAEKIRACYQRNKARDIYDLGTFATRPLDQSLIRRLVVLKLWQGRDTFDPERLMQKFREGRDFDHQSGSSCAQIVGNF